MVRTAKFRLPNGRDLGVDPRAPNNYAIESRELRRMKSIILPNGLTRRTANCLTKAGIPIEKEAIIKALKNGTLYPYRNLRNYGKYTHREVCRWAGVDASTLLSPPSS
jgi:hypothetical protein